MNTSPVLLRVFARCASPQVAPALQARLLDALAPFHAAPREAPQRYWKEPAWFEFTLAAPAATPMAALRALCPVGWLDCGDEDTPSWVWNPAPGAVFLDPAVTWAELLRAG